MTSRILLAAACLAALCSLLALSALGTPPDTAASGAEVAAWFAAHRESLRWFAWLTTVSAPPIAVMIAILRGLLPAPHRDVFLIGGTGLIATGAVQSWIWLGLALHADHLDPSVARTLLDVALFWGPVLTASTMMMIGPVTLVALAPKSGFPGWLTLLGAVTFVEQAVETITVFGGHGFFEPGGAMNMQLGAGLFFVWWFGFAIWAASRAPQLERRPGRRGEA